MKNFLVVLLVGLVVSGPTWGSEKSEKFLNKFGMVKTDTIGDVIRAYDKHIIQKGMIELTFGATGNGFVFYNSELTRRGLDILYCRPINSNLSGREYFSIFRKFVAQNNKFLEMPMINGGGILLFALIKHFPCN